MAPTSLAADVAPRAVSDLHGSRKHVFEQIPNFRDLGGLPAAGGLVRRGVLFRSATLHLASERDAQRLTDLGVRTVIDLRSDEERTRWASTGSFEPRTVVHAPLLRAPWASDDLSARGDAATFLARRYLEMLRGSADVITSILHLLADAEHHGVVFHCAAGKDRTGILAAVLLGVLGVDADTIADDYHATAPEMDDVRRIYTEADAGDGATMVDQPAAFLAAPRDAMSIVLHAIRIEWGTVSRYALANGTDPDAIAKLRATMIVES